MKKVQRSELVDYVTYEEQRAEIRKLAMAHKDARRIHVGANLTFLFENPTTVRYQVQEMMRAEKIVREADIQHELDTYNELLGGPGELGATLLVEIETPAERDVLLRRWRDVPERIYAKLADGRKIRPILDQRQADEERISSVQYLRFPVGQEVPVGLGVDAAALEVYAELTPGARAALAEDLKSV
ncbi:MAG: DUF3501 family protein [Myxococcota bacterium]